MEMDKIFIHLIKGLGNNFEKYFMIPLLFFTFIIFHLAISKKIILRDNVSVHLRLHYSTIEEKRWMVWIILPARK